MRPALEAIYRYTIEAFRADPRIVAAWEFGSSGKGTEDEYSDVDPVFVVRDEHYQSVHDGLRPMFEALSSRIVMFWPEGFNAADIANYAVIFEPRDRPGELLQYDMTIASESSVRDGVGKDLLTRSGGMKLLFDKTGLLPEVAAASTVEPYAPGKLLWEIERYWVYVYIHVKYLKRADAFKLLYAQQTLRDIHLSVLRALHPEAYWGWWAWSAKNVLARQEQEHLLRYFGSGAADAVASALSLEIGEFGADARRACAAWGLEYPEAVEREISGYLEREVGRRRWEDPSKGPDRPGRCPA